MLDTNDIPEHDVQHKSNMNENANHDFIACAHSMEASYMIPCSGWFLFSDVAPSCQMKFSNQVTSWQTMSK